ncbi:Birc2 [Symbiodinium sp. KB8]|nr:Birc2 [Symbiodinium sp. KB8]
MPPLPASKGNTEDEVKRSEEFLNQLSLGSTATGTPLTRDTARFEASRSRSGSASRHPEAEVPGDGCHLLEEEEPRRAMVWYSYGNMLNALAVVVSSLSYNRDTFADSVAMQQNQMYQEKNYHINWIASVREEMRDFLTIFMGKLQNTGVLNTLLFGISTGFLCEGELDRNAPDSLAFAYYSLLIISMLYFGCSILFCFIGLAIACAESRRFLLKFVPDVHDAYNVDYITKLLQWEGKGEALRVPFVMEPRRLAEKKEKQKQAGATEANAAKEDFYDHFESMMHEFNEPTEVEYLRKGGTTTRFWEGSPTSAEGDEEMGEGERLENSFYELIGRYSLLWDSCSMASHNSMLVGVFALWQSFSYYLFGHDMNRSLQARLGMYVTTTIASLALGGQLGRLLTVKTELDRKEHGAGEECFDPGRKLKHWVLKLLMILAPALVMSGALCANEVLLVQGYLAHGALHAYLAVFLFRALCKLPQQSGLPPAHPEKIRRLRGKGYGSKQADLDRGDAGLEPRESPEPMLRHLLFESEKKAMQTAMFMKRLLLKSHLVACLPWAWLALGAFQAMAVEVGNDSEVDVTEVNVTWGSHAFFSARSMTCSLGGQVWLASDDGVFAIARGADGGGVESIDCPALPLDENVKDVSALCSESSCWPAVLGSSGKLYSCNPDPDAAINPFTELPGISGFALAGEGFYVRKNNSILHFPARTSVARPLPGLIGFDILPNAGGEDLFLFSADRAASIQLRSAANGELRKWEVEPEVADPQKCREDVQIKQPPGRVLRTSSHRRSISKTGVYGVPAANVYRAWERNDPGVKPNETDTVAPFEPEALQVSQEEALRTAEFDLLRQLQKAVRTVILTATVSNRQGRRSALAIPCVIVIWMLQWSVFNAVAILSSVMSSSCFALSLDIPEVDMSASTEGLGIPQESQAVHELMAVTFQEVARNGCDISKAESLLGSLQSYAKARSESKQNTAIQHNAEIIKQQLGKQIEDLREQKTQEEKQLHGTSGQRRPKRKAAEQDDDKENRAPKQQAPKQQVHEQNPVQEEVHEEKAGQEEVVQEKEESPSGPSGSFPAASAGRRGGRGCVPCPMWYIVHLLKTVDANGIHFYKVGRTRSSCLGQRFYQYQKELLEVEPRLSLVSVVMACMFASEFHSKRFEHRIHSLMLRHKPALLLGARQKTREIYYEAALPFLKSLFEKSMAMTKEDFINELSSKTLTTSVFGDAQQEYPDDNTTEVEETDD